MPLAAERAKALSNLGSGESPRAVDLEYLFLPLAEGERAPKRKREPEDEGEEDD